LEVPEDMVCFIIIISKMISIEKMKKFQIKQVYLAAWQLRMERVVNECASHLIKDLTKDTCLDTRSLPGINRNKSFVDKVDQFIAENVSKNFIFNHVGLCLYKFVVY